jgi:hypothetical protein
MTILPSILEKIDNRRQPIIQNVCIILKTTTSSTSEGETFGNGTFAPGSIKVSEPHFRPDISVKT